MSHILRGRRVQLLLAASVAIALGAAACARTRVTVFDPGPRPAKRTSPEAIRLYGAQLPSCAYVEIGRVTAEGGEFVSWGKVVRAARRAAHEMGGDAIIRVREGSRVSGVVLASDAVAATETASLSGPVIRFADAKCTT
jgi:hypothetical protein